MTQSLTRTALGLALTGFVLAACGSKDDTADSGGTDATATATGTGTGAATGTGTGAATGTGTGSATGTGATTGFVRAVNILPEFPNGINVLSNGAELLADFPLYGNTDAAGSDYVPFPAASYTVGASDPADDRVIVNDPGHDVVAGEYYTILFHGSEFLEAAYPGLGLGPAVTQFDDPPNPAPAGQHHVNFIHTSPFRNGAVDVMVGTDTWQIAYGEMTGPQAVASGSTTITLDWDLDMVADATFTINLADTGWTNIYLAPYDDDGDLNPAEFLLLHHVYQADNTPYFP